LIIFSFEEIENCIEVHVGTSELSEKTEKNGTKPIKKNSQELFNSTFSANED